MKLNHLGGNTSDWVSPLLKEGLYQKAKQIHQLILDDNAKFDELIITKSLKRSNLMAADEKG